MARKTAKKTTKKKAKKATTRKTKKQNGWFVSLFKFCVKWGLVVGLWLFIILGGIMLWYASELPSITKSMVFERRPTVIIKASNGDIVDRYGDIKGEIVDVNDLPEHVKNAVLATEDRRFYSHYGMDPVGVARAFVVNITRGGFVQGGSTLTQQLAKNLFLTRERTIKRKIQELILSFQLERELTKDEILSAYLNRVYLGGGAYGIDAAANIYFNKPAKNLNIREAATIAGLLKAPSRYSPSANPERSAQRTKTVMQAMVDAGYITQEDITRLAKLPPAPRRKPSSGESVRYYTDYIVSQLDDLIGTIEQDVIVETTMDVGVQKELEQAITKGLMRYGSDYNVSQAAGMFMRLDGSVIALMGGRDYSDSEFNRVTESLRPPGSSFKPVVYLAALENGYYMNSILMDEPRNYGRYRPRNYGNQYYGAVTLYKALTLSLNTIAVELASKVTPAKVIDTARRLGITADLEASLSTALGSNGIPMTQMVAAYATIGRNGSAVDPYAIKRILDKDGAILYERTPPKENRQVARKTDIYQLKTMMKSVINNGTGRGASVPYQAGGKTGTSQDFRDAWFIGFTDKYVGAVWFGNDDNSETKRLTGGSAPARVWREVMLKAQTRGGKSYGGFYGFNADAETGEFGGFDELMYRILGDDYKGVGGIEWGFEGQEQQPQQQNNNSGWFGGLFGGSQESRQNQRETQQKYKPSKKRNDWNVNE